MSSRAIAICGVAATFAAGSAAVGLMQERDQTARKTALVRSSTLASPDGGVAVIDVMTMYTIDAAEVLSPATLRARAEASVAFTNEAFTCSEVQVQLRLLGVEPLPFRRSGPMKEFLGTVLSNQSTPAGKALWDVRQARAADIMMVIVGGGTHEGLAHVSPPGGLSTWWPNATALVTAVDGAPGASFAHEIGHLMGAGHELTGPPDGSYAHGWKGTQHYTLMATTGERRVNLFSNPRITHLGVPVGIEGQADNARALNENRRTVEKWTTPQSARPLLTPVACSHDYQ